MWLIKLYSTSKGESVLKSVFTVEKFSVDALAQQARYLDAYTGYWNTISYDELFIYTNVLELHINK